MNRLTYLRKRLSRLRSRRRRLRWGMAFGAVALAALWILAAMFLFDWLLEMTRLQRVLMLAVGVASLLIIMGIDRWIVTFTAGPRWIMMLSALALTLGVAGWLLVRPLARSFTHTGIARLVELHHPEFEERISSTVELLTSTDPQEMRGSQALIAATSAVAVSDAKSIRPGREISMRIARRFLVAAGVVLSVLTVLFAAWPEATWSQFRRSIIPTANIHRVSSDSMLVDVVTNDSVRPAAGQFDFAILRGHQLVVEAKIDNESIYKADFRVAPTDSDNDEVIAMNQLPDPREGWRSFQVGYAAENDDFRFRIAAGDAVSRYYSVRVVDEPQVGKITVGVIPPAYTGLQPVIRVLEKNQVPRALVGSTVTVTTELNRPMETVKGIVDGKSVAIKAGDENASTFTMSLKKPGIVRWEINARDEFGFEGKSQGRTIQAMIDRPPTVSLRIPYEDKIDKASGKPAAQKSIIRLKPGDRLPVVYEMSDDVAMVRAARIMSIDGKPAPDAPLALEPSNDRASGKFAIDLSSPQLENASKITFHAAAWDAKPGRKQPGRSKTFTIIVDKDEKESILDRAAEALPLLERLLHAAQSMGRWGDTIRYLLQQAVAFYALGDLPSALASLAQAFPLAEPEGYVRIFVDEGEPMRELLRSFSHQRPTARSAYVDRLLTAFGAAAGDETPVVAHTDVGRSSSVLRPSPTQAWGVEPLSARELEVLHLMADGLKYAQISDQLVISLNTVRHHTRNIFGKLDVHSRAQAIVRARELGLL